MAVEKNPLLYLYRKQH